jgi:SAM-dependent methyltransferase
MPDPRQHNKAAWDRRARLRLRHTASALDQHLANPLPIVDPEGWLGNSVRNKRALCLASGGGLQSGLLAAAGAIVTVVDISSEMLNLDRQLARAKGFSFRLVEASMDNLGALTDGEFDLVLQPVSTCYIPNITAVYAEVSRVLTTDGIYISQHKQPASLQARALPSQAGGYLVEKPYYGLSNELPPTELPGLYREEDCSEFLHRWEEILGSLCRSGFVIEDVTEPKQLATTPEMRAFVERSNFLPPYIKIKARRLSSGRSETKPKILVSS